MQKTVKVQKGKLLYINLPTEISKEMEIEKGETALIDVLDKNTIKITIIED